MGLSYIRELYEDCLNNNSLCCTDKQIEEFLSCGIIFKTNDGCYVDSFGEKLTINLIKPQNFNINLNNILEAGIDYSKKNKFKKIYYMTSNLYEKYKNSGLIIVKEDREYFRLFVDEYWLVYKV